MAEKVVKILLFGVMAILILGGLYLTFRCVYGLSREPEDPRTKRHFVKNGVVGISSLLAAYALSHLIHQVRIDYSAGINPKNIPTAIVMICAGLVWIRHAINTFPRKEFRFLFARLRLKRFRFRVSDAATVVTMICEDVKENHLCTDKLRGNLDIISDTFQAMKEADEKKEMSYAQKEACKDLFVCCLDLFNKDPDVRGWEAETDKIISRLGREGEC